MIPQKLLLWKGRKPKRAVGLPGLGVEFLFVELFGGEDIVDQAALKDSSTVDYSLSLQPLKVFLDISNTALQIALLHQLIGIMIINTLFLLVPLLAKTPRQVQVCAETCRLQKLAPCIFIPESEVPVTGQVKACTRTINQNNVCKQTFQCYQEKQNSEDYGFDCWMCLNNNKFNSSYYKEFIDCMEQRKCFSYIIQFIFAAAFMFFLL